MRISSFLALSLFVFPLLAVAACGAPTDDEVERPHLALEDLIRLPEPVVADCIECDFRKDDEDNMYLCWAQRREGEATYDIYFSHGANETALRNSIERVTDTSADSRKPCLAVNAQGDVVIVWEEGTSPSRAIATSTRPDSTGSFGPVAEFAPNTSDNANPRCIFDHDQTLHVVWDAAGEVWHRRRPSGSSASNALELPVENGSEAAFPDIVEDQAERLYVVWQFRDGETGYTVLQLARSSNGGTSFPDYQELPLSPLSLGTRYPRLAPGAQAGHLFVAYQIGTSDTRRIRMSKFVVGTSGATLGWSRDLATSDEGSLSTPSIAATDDGSIASVFVAWLDDDEVQARVSSDDGNHFGDTANLSQGVPVAETALAMALHPTAVAFPARAANSGTERAIFVRPFDASTE